MSFTIIIELSSVKDDWNYYAIKADNPYDKALSLHY